MEGLKTFGQKKLDFRKNSLEKSDRVKDREIE